MKQKLESPKNQWSLAIRYLIDFGAKGVTMKDVCKEYFYKFQTRLLEVEKGRKDKLKIRRLPMKGKNRFGHEMSFLNYKSLAPRPYLINLYNKINKLGVKSLHL